MYMSKHFLLYLYQEEYADHVVVVTSYNVLCQVRETGEMAYSSRPKITVDCVNIFLDIYVTDICHFPAS